MNKVEFLKPLDKRNPDYLNQLKGAAHRLFKSRDGELVMTFLMDQYVLCRFKDDQLARQAGRRDVVLTLLDLMEDKSGTS